MSTQQNSFPSKPNSGCEGSITVSKFSRGSADACDPGPGLNLNVMVPLLLDGYHLCMGAF